LAPTHWMRFGISLLVLAGLGLGYQLLAPILQPLPVYMALPAVSLTDQDGKNFELQQTRGKVVLLSPIYTHCPDICPITTGKMKQLQGEVRSAGLADQVQFVSFTVDPQRDTPEVLAGYASVYGADLSNWVFLSGSAAQTQALIQRLGIYVEKVYYVAGTPYPETSLSGPPPNSSYLVNHTDRWFLIDREGNVRALPPGSRSDVGATFQLIQKLIR